MDYSEQLNRIEEKLDKLLTNWCPHCHSIAQFKLYQYAVDEKGGKYTADYLSLPTNLKIIESGTVKLCNICNREIERIVHWREHGSVAENEKR